MLLAYVDCMLPEDLGLSPELQFFSPSTSTAFNEVQRVTKTTIYECRNFCVCIFFLPAKAVIPLHNHPGMTVFSKLLQETMHIKSYDWVDAIIVTSNHHTSSKLRLGKLKANDVVGAACDTWVLYPQSGENIHEFRAIAPCAMLDVIGLPYSKEIAQDCKYYRDSPLSSVDVGNPIINFTPSLLVGPSRGSKDTEACELIRVSGKSRFKLGSYASVYWVTLVPSVEIPERLHTNIQICFHRNDSLMSCQCTNDNWKTVQKGVWNSVMSLYEEKYLDVKFTGEIPGFVTVTVEEFQLWPMFCLALGFMLLLLAPTISSWIPFLL